MEAFLNEFGYAALMIGTFLEGETAILIASSLIPTGLFGIPQTVFFSFIGSFASDWMYYTIGHANGKYFISRRPALQKKIRPVQAFFETHRLQILLSYRFLYGFRIIIPLVIGMSKTTPVQFLGYSVFSGVVWATTVTMCGLLAGKIFQIEAAALEENVLFVVLACAALGVMIGYILKRIATRNVLFQ